MTRTERYEAAIIGAGPIGLELAVAFKHAGVDYVQFEAGAIGATMQWWAPETRFFSSPERIAIAGVPLVTVDQSKATREEYLAYLRGVAQQFDLNIRSYTRVVKIERHDDGFAIFTQPSLHGVGGPAELAEKITAAHDQATPQAAPAAEPAVVVRNVVLAIGDMHLPRMINVPGEDLPHVSHFLGEPHQYFNQRVLIVGGKNSAVEAALRLYRCGAHVIMSYRGSEFDPKRIKYWLKPELDWLISKGRIEFHPRTVVKAIHAPPRGTVLANVEDCDDTREIDADFVLLLTGYVQDSTLFEQLGVELVGESCAPRYDRSTMQTNVPGVYVAGTAAGGSQQRTRLFIENSHEHVRKIVRAISGSDVPWLVESEFSTLEES